MERPTDIILIGAGGFGSTWDLAIRQHGLRVAALVDSDEAVLHERAKCYPEASLHNGRSDAWAAVPADLVIDAAPPTHRAGRIARALASGKTVIAAKPVALEPSEVRDLARSETADARVFVAMQKRYLPAFARLKTLCSEGRLGQIGYIGIDLQVDGTFWTPGMSWRSCMPWPSLNEGAVHHLDLVKWLVQPTLQFVSATSWNPSWSPFRQAADFAATLHCDNHLVIHYLSRWSAQRGPVSHYFSGFRVEGDRGAAWIVDGRLYANNQYEPVPGDGDGMMDLSKLNAQLLADVLHRLNTGAPTGDLGLSFHSECLEVVSAIRGALSETNGRSSESANEPEQVQ